MLSNRLSDRSSDAAADALPAIRAEALSKCYQLYDRPADRLRQGLWGRLFGRRYYREFWALRDVSLEVAPGEVLGIPPLTPGAMSTNQHASSTSWMLGSVLRPSPRRLADVG